MAERSGTHHGVVRVAAATRMVPVPEGEPMARNRTGDTAASSRAAIARSRSAAGEPARELRPRCLIIDDFPATRAGLRALLSEAVSLEFVGEAGDATLGMELARRLKPDLVLLEVAMFTGGGLDVLRGLRAELPDTRVLAVTISQELDLVAQAVRAGVHGYLIKTASEEALVTAVQRVLSGELAFDPMLVIQAMRASEGHGASSLDEAPEPLTAREIEVLGWVSHGHTNREIAGRLFVAVGTVKIHVEHILAKLGAADRTDAAVKAVEMGLLDAAAARHMPPGETDLAQRQTRGEAQPAENLMRSALPRPSSSHEAGK